MAGKVGRSGRKSWDKELQMKELFQLSYQVLKRGLLDKSGTIPHIKKLEIAAQLFVKMIPQEQKHSGSISTVNYILGNSQEDLLSNRDRSVLNASSRN